jgi:predicted secreted protein
MSKISGNLIYIEWDSANVVGLTDKSIDLANDMIDVTNQQSSGGWKEYLPGERGATISFSGVYDEAGAEGATSLFADMKLGTSVSFKIGEDIATGGAYWSGGGLVSGITVNGPKNDAASYSGTIQVTGVVAQSLTGCF